MHGGAIRSNATHANRVLQAAAFILALMSCPSLTGRVAANVVSVRSSDQKSGFPKPMPMGKAKSMGIIASHVSVRNVACGPRLVSQHKEHNIRLVVSIPAVGKTRPARRHSIQNNAASADFNGLRR